MADASIGELIDAMRLDARAKLLDLLDEVTGRKVLVLDSTIVGPLDMIVNPSDLKDHGVQTWRKLSDQPVTGDDAQMIFLVRCFRVELIDWIAAQILHDEAQGRDRTYTVVLIPRKTEQCLERLSRGNVRANVTIVEYDLHFFPFDRDTISMEVPGAFHDFHVMGDPSSPFYVAKALTYLQSKFGTASQVHSIGLAGKFVVEIMHRLHKEELMCEALQRQRPSRDLSQQGVPPIAPHVAATPGAATEKQQAGPRISEIILIDRRVDLFSVLCSQFTYQALIDTVFGIQNNSVDISSANLAKDRNAPVRLASDDGFFAEIRDLHIDRLGPLLSERAMAIQKTYSEKDNVKNPSEMAEYIKKFKTAQSAHPLLELHINLAHHLKSAIQSESYRTQLKVEDDITAGNAQHTLETLEELIDDQKPIHQVLRLLCLYSFVNSGVRPKNLDQLKRSIVQAYGFEHLLTLCNAERLGLLRYQQGKSSWSSIKRQFNLFVEDTAAESDISYAYSGYAPLSVRLVQMTRSLPKGWRSCPEALSLLYGPALQHPDQSMALPPETPGSAPSIVVVCFIGGVTYGEIAALRKLSEMEEGRRRFLVLTTEFINAKKFFSSIRCEQAFNHAPEPEDRRASPSVGLGFWPGGR